MPSPAEYASRALPPVSSSGASFLSPNEVDDMFIGGPRYARRSQNEITINKQLSDNLFSVAEDSFDQDPVVSAVGGSFMIDGDSITTYAESSTPFDPSLLLERYYPEQNTLGIVNTTAILNAVDPFVDLRSLIGNSYVHTAYNVPVAPVGSATTKYNFYINDYEHFLDDPIEDMELAALDVYGTVLSMGGKLNTSAQSIYTLKGEDGQDLTRNFSIEDQITYRDQPKENIIDYFRTYATSNITPADRYKNVIFPQANVSDANSVFAMSKDSFPFYVSIDVGLAPNGKIADAMIDANFADKFVVNLASSVQESGLFERERFLQQNFDSIKYADSRVYDAGDIISYEDVTFTEKSVLLGTNSQYQSSYSGVQPTFAQNLEALHLLVDMRNIITEYARDFYDVLKGERNYSEVIAYRIAKFASDDLDNPIQNFYFFNAKDVTTFNFMDTQVVPGKSYKYKVYSYSFVCNTEYEYQDIVMRDPAFVVRVKSSPDSKIIENVIYETDAFVTSLPPVAPNVEFRHFIGNERKIQVLFQKTEQRKFDQPVTFNAEEAERAQMIRNSQGVGPDSPIMFSNDDEAVVYEIFRTQTPPANVNVFSDKLWKRVTESEILDPVRPDATYYYIFRTIDNHGNVSNPTSPYEVTLIGGVSPYLLVSEYKYPSATVDKKERTKGFKRFLRIAPALPQLMVNQEGFEHKDSSLDVNNAILGVTDQGKIWGKKYKIRIISKETGKKIDFNLEYDYNFEYREQ